MDETPGEMYEGIMSALERIADALEGIDSKLDNAMFEMKNSGEHGFNVWVEGGKIGQHEVSE